MTDRTVRVTVTAAVNGYLSNMEKARQQTDKNRDASKDAAAKFREQNQAMSEIGVGVAAFGAVAAVAFGLAVSKFAEFDQAMSNVKAATQETRANMDLLREAALEAGASTVFSATEAANAIEELGKNGLTTAQILGGGLDSALSLASAGQLGVARAAEIAAVTMKQFNLEASELPHVADLLAAGAGKAAGDVEDMAQALNQTALVAESTGLSIEETTGTLAAFADAGLIGSDAGTSFKSMLQRLTPVSGEAAAEMERLNISAFDAGGNFIGIANFAGVLEDRLKDLTPEQQAASKAIIFGSDAVRAANVLYDEGADGIQKYIDQTNDSGYAAKVAADRLNNLTGDVEKLGGALDTALIKAGSGANDTLRALTQGATGLVDAVGQLPGPVLAGVGGLTGLVAVVGLVGGGALIAVPKIAQFKTALATLNVSGASAARGVGLASGALALAAIAFSLWAAKQAEATATTAEFQDSLDETTGAVTDYTRELVAKKLSEADAFADAKKYGITQDELTDAVLGTAGAMEVVKGKLDSASDGMVGNQARAADLAAKYGDASTGADKLSGFITDAKKDLEDQAAAADDSADSTGDAATAYQEAADKASELQGNLRTLIDTINEANGVGQDAVSANANYQAALAEISEEVQRQKDAYTELNGTLDGFTLSLDETTVSGSANASMLSDVAGKAQDAALAQYDLDLKTMGAKDATDKYAGTLASQRQAFIDSAVGAGYNADEVQKLADKVFALPSEKEVQILADASAANAVMDGFVSSWDGKRISVTVDTYGGTTYQVAGSTVKYNENGGLYQGGVKAFANGGFPSGMYAGRRGGIHKFAEESLPWEVYISPKPSERQRNLGLWAETGRLLGATAFANGGMPEYATNSRSSQAAQVKVGAPSVQVFIGDEEVTGRVRVVVKDEINQVARSARMGGGR